MERQAVSTKDVRRGAEPHKGKLARQEHGRWRRKCDERNIEIPECIKDTRKCRGGHRRKETGA